MKAKHTSLLIYSILVLFLSISFPASATTLWAAQFANDKVNIPLNLCYTPNYCNFNSNVADKNTNQVLQSLYQAFVAPAGVTLVEATELTQDNGSVSDMMVCDANGNCRLFWYLGAGTVNYPDGTSWSGETWGGGTLSTGCTPLSVNPSPWSYLNNGAYAYYTPVAFSCTSWRQQIFGMGPGGYPVYSTSGILPPIPKGPPSPVICLDYWAPICHYY